MKIPDSSVLVVDDDANHLAMLAAVLREHVDTVQTADSAERALTLLEQDRPDLILLDMRMPGMGGLGFLGEARQKNLTVPVVVVTAFAEVEDAVEAMKLGASDYLSKPIDLVLLEELLDRYVRKDSVVTAPTHPPLPSGIIFRSPLMEQVLAEVAAAAGSLAPVLLVGESGVGKEVLAELLHRWSDRPEGPMVSLNMTALPETLMESELFGHEKGAFTGAERSRRGHFEEASGGTLFLDEIGELPLDMQPKLLRALETGRIRRLGGNEEISVDLRLVSATNRDVEKEVSEGRFRMDLYYRLAVFAVEIPPLRERPEEILPLARAYLEAPGEKGKHFSQAAQHCLHAYPWPGNVRELHNSIQRAAILAAGEWILPEHLPPAVRGSGGRAASREQEPRALAEIEKEAILKALKRCEGNRTQAARELGISRRKLLYRLKEYEAEE